MTAGSPLLRVMSFNVRGFTSPVDGAHRWPRRAARNVATVRAYGPDLLGCQEVHDEALATYREHLPDYGVVPGPAAGAARDPEYNAILYAPERLEVLESGGFWLSETPDVPSSSWRARVVRSANWATFAVRGTDRVFRHVNTHLDHWSGLARERGAQLVLREVAGGALPTVLTGDFNCPPGSAPYRGFLAQGLRDAHAGAGDEATFHAFGGVRALVARRLHRVVHGRGPLRLDWILVGDGDRRWRVEDAEIVRDPDTGTFPSDHHPVTAALRLF